MSVSLPFLTSVPKVILVWLERRCSIVKARPVFMSGLYVVSLLDRCVLKLMTHLYLVFSAMNALMTSDHSIYPVKNPFPSSN